MAEAPVQQVGERARIARRADLGARHARRPAVDVDGAHVAVRVAADRDHGREVVDDLRALEGARPLLEVSGGITLERIAELSAAGVDLISCGALTHSAPAADIALDLSL